MYLKKVGVKSVGKIYAGMMLLYSILIAISIIGLSLISGNVMTIVIRKKINELLWFLIK